MCCSTFQRFPCATLPKISKTKVPMRSIQQATLRKFSQSFQTSTVKHIIKILKKWQVGCWCAQPLKVFTPPPGGVIHLSPTTRSLDSLGDLQSPCAYWPRILSGKGPASGSSPPPSHILTVTRSTLRGA